MTTTQNGQLLNFINGQWRRSSTTTYGDVRNPATAEVQAHVPLSPGAEVDAAVQAAAVAFQGWRRTPVGDRIQPLFRLKVLLDENLNDLARTITNECGKILAESVGEMRRGIENVEVACGMPVLMQGYNNEDIASGIDEHMIRQPLGVVAAITPFNFPGMIPLWFLPYAVATGNCFILKPSEKVPMTSQMLFELIEAARFRQGCCNWSTAAKRRWMPYSITRRCAPSALSARRPWPSMSTAGPQPTASAPSVRAAPKTQW